MKKKIFLIFFFLNLLNYSCIASEIEIINNFKKINNISFDFKQNINDKTEEGNCIIQYPKKIYCNYNLSNEKILVSNGKSLVIKTKTGFYRYPLNKTPLNLILDKNYLLNKIENLDGKIIENKFISYNFIENDNEISIFFNKQNYDLVGWQTLDIYQNLSITFLSSVSQNKDINEDLFILPKQN